MICVTLSSEPKGFDIRVRIPGTSFLASTPNPTNKDWRRNSYWTRVHSELYLDHKGICMYSGSWTPRASQLAGDGFTTIDHFTPKCSSPDLAYEWTNFRLCREILNIRKDDHNDVLDPVGVNNEWFHLDFSTFLILPDASLTVDKPLFKRVEQTVSRLQLNSDTRYVTERANVVSKYVLGKISFSDVSDRYPFIAYQMERQDFDANYLEAFRSVLADHTSKVAP